MPINDKAVLTAATGFIFTAPVGTAAPTPVELAALDLPKLIREALGEGEVAPDAGVTPDVDDDAAGGKAGRSTVVADPKAPLPVAWVNVGHTSRSDLPEFGYDGGDLEVRGTWQNESLREVETDPVQDYLTFKLHQFDNGALELYYGKDGLAGTPGAFGVAGGTTVPVEKALFILVVDGANKVGFHAHKASFRRDDAIEMATDEFASLPVRATFLKHNSEVKFSWINKDLFVP
jgi:hypothetical protein